MIKIEIRGSLSPAFAGRLLSLVSYIEGRMATGIIKYNHNFLSRLAID